MISFTVYQRKSFHYEQRLCTTSQWFWTTSLLLVHQQASFEFKFLNCISISFYSYILLKLNLECKVTFFQEIRDQDTIYLKKIIFYSKARMLHSLKQSALPATELLDGISSDGETWSGLRRYDTADHKVVLSSYLCQYHRYNLFKIILPDIA